MKLHTGKTYFMRYRDLIIPLRYVYSRGEAHKFRIACNKEKQAVYLPKKCVHLISGVELGRQDWFWSRSKNYHKLDLAGVLERYDVPKNTISKFDIGDHVSVRQRNFDVDPNTYIEVPYTVVCKDFYVDTWFYTLLDYSRTKLKCSATAREMTLISK